jgi:hypothetical protein
LRNAGAGPTVLFVNVYILYCERLFVKENPRPSPVQIHADTTGLKKVSKKKGGAAQAVAGNTQIGALV